MNISSINPHYKFNIGDIEYIVESIYLVERKNIDSKINDMVISAISNKLGKAKFFITYRNYIIQSDRLIIHTLKGDFLILNYN